MKISVGSIFTLLRCSIFFAIASVLLGCGDSGPSDASIVSDLTDRLSKYTFDERRYKLTDAYEIKSIEVVGRRMEGDVLTAVVKITVVCKMTLSELYTADVLGLENKCVSVGGVRSNELSVKYTKFDTGWRQQSS